MTVLGYVEHLRNLVEMLKEKVAKRRAEVLEVLEGEEVMNLRRLEIQRVVKMLVRARAVRL